MLKDPNIVFVGRKPVMSYVLAVMTSFNSSDTKNVTVKARGRSITTAVDVAEVVKRRYMKDLRASKITIGTEELPREDGGTKNVSTMEIMLSRK